MTEKITELELEIEALYSKAFNDLKNENTHSNNNS